MSAAVVAVGLSKSFSRGARQTGTLKEALLRGRMPAAPRGFALEDVSFEIPAGQAVGIIGNNGSGKSTLFKLLLGIYAPTSGEVLIRGRAAAVIELTAGFHPDLTGHENIDLNGALYGMSHQEIEAKRHAIVAFADIGDHIHEPLRVYSSGMRARLSFSLAIHVDADVLLFDEVLAVGDAGFREKCITMLEGQKRLGKTIIVVSHDMQQIERLCDRALWIDRGRLRHDDAPSVTIAAYRDHVSASRAG